MANKSPSHSPRWTLEQDERLEELAVNPRLSYAMMAAFLNKTGPAVQARMQKLGLPYLFGKHQKPMGDKNMKHRNGERVCYG